MSDNNYYNTNTETPLYLAKNIEGYKLTPTALDRTVTFYKDNEIVGTLDFNGEEMTFTGKADESAQIFIKLPKDHWGMDNEK